MSVRVCVITTPSPFLLDQKVFPALGILKVAAVLEQAGYAVDHLDLTGISNYEDAVRDYDGDATVFAITATTPQMPSAVKVRRVLGNKGKVILGGPHATLIHAAAKRGNIRAKRMLEEMLAEFDCIVCGDGEKSIFTALHSKGIVDADDPKSIMWQTSKDFTESPWPARHLLDMDSYHYSIDGEKAAHLVGQLGCPYMCAFCSGRNSPMLRRIRLRTPENIIAEAVHLHKTYGVRGINCYDEETDILTKRGWVRFRDILPSDEVATLDHSTGSICYEVPMRIIRFPYSGKLVTFKNRSVDLSVTPEHGMWAQIDGKYQRIMASELASLSGPFHMLQRVEWIGADIQTFSIPAYNVRFLGRNIGSPKVLDGVRTFPARVWVKFMAWYLSEGSCYRPKVRNGRGYRICIKQDLVENLQKVEEIHSVLRELGYRYSYSSNQFHIDSKELYEYLRQFGTSHFKHVPAEFKMMSKELIRLFVDTYLKGDGNCSWSGQRTIMSSSQRMRYDLQEMAIKGGEWAYADDRFERITLAKQKDLTINSVWGRGDHIGEVDYSGDVHCVTVSSGVVLVRRNGKAVWCGNCFDDELNVNKEILTLMRGMKDAAKELGIEWRLRGFIKSELFTEEQAKVMYEAGFRWILVGFESGSDRILTNIQKKATREENTRCMEIAHKHGLKVKALMSLGHAGESMQSVQDTYDWLLEAKPSDLDVTVITPYPGSPYWDEAVDIGGGIYRYTAPKTGDFLFMEEVDFTKTADYYKGILGSYVSHVWTDHLTRKELVEQRDWLELTAKEKLGIDMPPSSAATMYDHSTGMTPQILRSSK